MIIVICLRSERKEILSGKGRAHFGRVIVGSLEKGTKALWYRLGGQGPRSVSQYFRLTRV